MTIDPCDPADLPDAAAGQLNVEDVIARLDKLWDDAPHESLGLSQSLVGRQIGQYSILELIGHGAFGIVYRAYHVQLDQEVALKIPRPEVLLDKRKLRRFESEAQIVASLDHPSIVPICEAHLTGPAPYIALAFIDGPDLGRFLGDRAEEIPWPEAAQFVAELADAVHHAHERGVFHRDLKPSNVLLVSREGSTREPGSLQDYQPKLTDFGLAKLAQGSLEDTRSSMVVGTPLYMAPEVIGGLTSGPAEGAADIYSLGCLLYELLTGRPPISGDSYAQVISRLRDKTPERIRKYRQDVPRALEAICSQCLEKNPAARYRSAAGLGDDLKRVLHGDSVALRKTRSFSRISYWASQPQRIRDAGWFAMCLNIAMAIWLLVLVLINPYFMKMSSIDRRHNILDCAMAATLHVVLAMIGFYTLRRYRWAIWTGLILSGCFAFMAAYFAEWSFPIFEAIYRGAHYHQIANLLIQFLTAVVQFLLYSFAVNAIRKQPLNE